MFERYSEKARRVLFFARYEASTFGSDTIETHHLLLGLFREDREMALRFLKAGAALESIRKQLEARFPPGKKVSTSTDLPFSEQSRQILAYAAEEAERLEAGRTIETWHLLLGLLRDEKCVATGILQEYGLKLPEVREEIARRPREVPSSFSREDLHRLVDGLPQNLWAAVGQILQALGKSGGGKKSDPD